MRAKFSLANTVLITSPTQAFLLLHSQLTSKQRDKQKVCSPVCDMTSQLLRAIDCCFYMNAFCVTSLFSSVLTPLCLSLRCSSKKQPVLCALPATELNMDSTALGSSGAFGFLVRPPCRPHFRGGSHQSSAPLFPLTARSLWPYPSRRARGLPKGV